MALWCHVIDQAADDETIGAEVQGQETLDVPTDTSSTTRPLTDTTPAPSLSRARKRQSTFTGDTVTDTEEAIRKPWLKDPTSRQPSESEKVAQHPAQVRLDVWMREDGIDRWDVDTSRTEAVVAQPEGRVYYPTAPAASPGGQARLPAFTAGQWNVTIPG